MKKSDITKNRKSGRDKLKQGKDIKELSSDEFKVLLVDVSEAAAAYQDLRLPNAFRFHAERVLKDDPQHSE